MAKKGLGRGLDALLGANLEERTYKAKETKHEEKEENKEFIKLDIAFVEPNREQPRKTFDEEELSSLAESIKTYGIIQPITVKNENNGFYSIVAGERRWRAAKMAGLTEVPVRVVEFDALEELSVSLIENLQRTDLNPVEEALGYKRLLEEYSLTQEDISKKVGKSRSAVANALRLLALSDKILKLLKEKAITGGHAKALLLVKDEAKRELLAEKIVLEDLSVRAAEAMAQALNTEKAPREKIVHRKSPEVLDLEKSLSEKMGTKVMLDEKKKGGKIQIEYYNADQREAILNYLKKYK